MPVEGEGKEKDTGEGECEGHGTRQASRLEPGIVVLAKAQFLNQAAEDAGRLPFWLCALALALSILVACFPLVRERYRSAMLSSNPARYPEIGLALRSAALKGWDLRVEGGMLRAGASAPAHARIGSWDVLIEPATASSGAEMSAEPNKMGLAPEEEGSDRRLILFGSNRFAVSDARSGNSLSGSWEELEGFELKNLSGPDVEKKINMFLFSSATSGLRRESILISLITAVQVLLLCLMLGFLLSLSKVKAQGSTLSTKRAAGFMCSLKTTMVVGLGPSLAVALIVFFFPLAAGMSWMLFTLFFGGRIVLIYMGRFKNKKSR